MAQLRSRRDEVVLEVTRRRREDADRWNKLPPADAPAVARRRELTKAQRSQLVEYVHVQSGQVQTWVSQRGNEYFSQGHGALESDWWACLDCLCWQRNTGATEALKWLDETWQMARSVVEPE